MKRIVYLNVLLSTEGIMTDDLRENNHLECMNLRRYYHEEAPCTQYHLEVQPLGHEKHNLPLLNVAFAVGRDPTELACASLIAMNQVRKPPRYEQAGICPAISCTGVDRLLMTATCNVQGQKLNFKFRGAPNGRSWRPVYKNDMTDQIQ